MIRVDLATFSSMGRLWTRALQVPRLLVRRGAFLTRAQQIPRLLVRVDVSVYSDVIGLVGTKFDLRTEPVQPVREPVNQFKPDTYLIRSKILFSITK